MVTFTLQRSAAQHITAARNGLKFSFFSSHLPCHRARWRKWVGRAFIRFVVRGDDALEVLLHVPAGDGMHARNAWNVDQMRKYIHTFRTE